MCEWDVNLVNIAHSILESSELGYCSDVSLVTKMVRVHARTKHGVTNGFFIIFVQQCAVYPLTNSREKLHFSRVCVCTIPSANFCIFHASFEAHAL